MDSSDYEKLDGLGMAQLLANGDTTPEALLKCAVQLAHERNPSLNCLTYSEVDAALARAKAWTLKGPFQGVPFLLKDSGVASKHFKSSLGSRLFDDMSYDFDATVVQRFDDAGFIPFARSTVSELCMGPSTEAVRNGGATRNPWDADRSVGGSSGGAAAAVAARIVPVAHGSDGGGSIRIPAACCGVYGLKPSRGRVPMGPTRGEGWGGMASDGVISVSVRDTAAALDVIGIYEPGAPYAAPEKASPYLQIVKNENAPRLRIGVWREAWNGIEIASQCQDAVSHAASLCQELGHQVSDVPLATIDYEAFVRAHGTILATNIALAVDARLAVLGHELRDDSLEPVIREGYFIGKSIGASQYVQAVQTLHAIGRAFASAMRDVDILLTPTLTQLPALQGYLALDNTGFWNFRHRVSRYATFLAVVNAAGNPAASLPLSWTPQGLPVAVQLIGHFAREDMVLALSAELERAAPWADRRPQFDTDKDNGPFTQTEQV